MQESNLILLCRPEGEQHASTTALQALNFTVLNDHLLTVAYLPAPILPTFEKRSILVFTSRNSLRALAALTQNAETFLEIQNLPLFAVGKATADLGGQMGFTEVFSAEGSGTDLIDLIQDRYGGATLKNQSIYYFCGRQTTGIIEKSALPLLCRTFHKIEVYETIPSNQLSYETIQAFKNQKFFAVMVFSRRTAETLAGLIKTFELQEYLDKIYLISISGSVSEACAKLPWRHIVVGRKPDFDSMLQALQVLKYNQKML